MESQQGINDDVILGMFCNNSIYIDNLGGGEKMTLLHKIKEARDLFELHEDVKNELTNEVTKPTWHSFKLEAIRSENALYRKFSDIIQDASVDENSAYDFTIEALDAMTEILTDNEGDTRDLEDILTDPETLDQYAEAPIYNSDLLDWLAKGNQNEVDEAIDSFGWDGAGKSIITAIQCGYSEAWKNHYMRVKEALLTD